MTLKGDEGTGTSAPPGPLWLHPLHFTSRAMAQCSKMSPSLGALNILPEEKP